MKRSLKYGTRILLICCLLLTAVAPATGQNGTDEAADTSSLYGDTYQDTTAEAEQPVYTLPQDRNISDEDWNSLIADSAFSYCNTREGTEDTDIKVNSFWTRLIHLILLFFSSGIGQFLFWLLIISVLAYVLYRIFKGELGFIFGRKEQQSPDTQSTELITEEDLLSANWAEKTRQALGNGDTVMATRYTFLYQLQLLQQLELIHYRIDKTNYDYYTELEAGPVKDKYRSLLLRYEYAWFGRFPVSAADWQQTNALFNELRSLLGK